LINYLKQNYWLTIKKIQTILRGGYMTRTTWCVMIAISFFLFGCATAPVKIDLATFAPSERILAFQSADVDKTCQLIVVRDEGFIGSACYYALHVNGILAARLAPREKVILFIPPGEILLRVGRDPLGRGLCGAGKDEWTQRETSMKAGETKYFRMTIDANGKTDIFRTEP
jgi:hypothetical protein